MKRDLFNILSAVSLLLCVATMGLWILSIWLVIGWAYGGHSHYGFWSSHERIRVVNTLTEVPLTGFIAAPAGAAGIRWNDFGFEGYSSSTQSDVVIPDWFICSVAAVLPYLWLRSYRRHRLAQRRGLCPTCGYDLRASKDRCPECGTSIPVQTAGSAKA